MHGEAQSYWDAGTLKKVSGTQQTFKLAFAPDETEFLDYPPMNEAGNFVRFMVEADGGIQGVAGSAVFPGNTSYNVNGTIPAFRTTETQLKTFVPYVEYVRSGSKVTGLVWRVVNPSDVNTCSSGFQDAFQGARRLQIRL